MLLYAIFLPYGKLSWNIKFWRKDQYTGVIQTLTWILRCKVHRKGIPGWATNLRLIKRWTLPTEMRVTSIVDFFFLLFKSCFLSGQHFSLFFKLAHLRILYFFKNDLLLFGKVFSYLFNLPRVWKRRTFWSNNRLYFGLDFLLLRTLRFYLLFVRIGEYVFIIIFIICHSACVKIINVRSFIIILL